VSGSCFECHNGTISIGKNPAHIDSSNLCSACHNTESFLPAIAVDHTEVRGSCDSAGCHTLPVVHPKTIGQCDACHSTIAWVPVTFVDHAELLSGSCTECHAQKGGAPVFAVDATAQSQAHIPTPDGCDVCHSTKFWVPHNFTHELVGISGDCVSCHTVGLAATPKSPTHIPTTSLCESCHATTAWVPEIVVDHTQVLGSCDGCHDGVIAIGKSPTHIATSSACDSCHSTVAFSPVISVDHSQFDLSAGCFSCHDGQTATGKSPAHIQSSDLCEACHITAAFVPALTVDHTQIDLTNGCAICHDGIVALGQVTSHIPATDVCEACHNTTAFVPVAASAVDHTQVIGACAACHDGTIASGKSATHIATSDLCDSCHQSGPTPWVPVASAAVDHTQVVGVCSSCHDGAVATGKTVNHIPTIDECDQCHSTAQWIPAAVDHVNFVNNCIDCHNGVTASGKSALHIASSDICDACHQKFPATWEPVAAVAVDHTQVVGACFDCHNGTTASGKSASHIASSNVCDACHQPGPIPWAPVAPTAVDHAQVVGACFDCHNGTIATGKSATHSTTSNVCEACHASTAWAPLPGLVDHNEVLPGSCNECHGILLAATIQAVAAPGQPQDHVPTGNISCDACHSTTAWVPATFDHGLPGLETTCGTCHTPGVRATSKSATHIASSAVCDACHVGFVVWVPVAATAVDHTQVVGSCFDCHNGTVASGKSATHIPTSDVCDACHLPGPTPWIPVAPAAVDHTQVVGVCSTCHNGTLATGKTITHIPTVEECDACHSTVAWLPAAVDHTTFTGNCMTCHDGVAASGKSATHISSSDVCDACHQKFPATWVPVAAVAVDHTQVVGACFDCHNSTVASGKSATHIATSNLCDACHQPGPVPWIPVVAAAVDHAQVVGACFDCHNSTVASGKSATHILTSDVCDACHQPGPTPWIPVAPSAVDHAQVVGTCSSCHDGLIATGKIITHVPTVEECDVCHSTAAWLPAVVDHTTFSGNCMTCHDGVTASGKSATHIPTSDLCDACHQKLPATWVPVAPAAVDHTQVVGVCSSCHDGAIATGKSATHIPTIEECDICHGTAQWIPAAVDHVNFVNNCIDCHNGISASGKSATHIASSDICDTCHQKFPATWIPVAAFAMPVINQARYHGSRSQPLPWITHKL
jgi:hypothetical protein